MANIYESKHMELHKLLAKADNPDSSTLLIPDLQRPYVWKPNQVVLLVDSLIRGWPFGTLLLWHVRSSDYRDFPSRAFWRVVDRTERDMSVSITCMNPPAEYQMVLDDGGE